MGLTLLLTTLSGIVVSLYGLDIVVLVSRRFSSVSAESKFVCTQHSHSTPMRVKEGLCSLFLSFCTAVCARNYAISTGAWCFSGNGAAMRKDGNGKH